MLRNLEFTSHGMARYRERIEPMYENLDPKTFVYRALTHGYNLYELDRETQYKLRYIRRNSREGNVFIVYHSFCFIFHYRFDTNTYWLITVFDLPTQARFLYNNYTK